MKKITGIITLTITLFLTFGCNNRSVGVENNNRAEYLTRHILYHQTVNEVMGFATDLGTGCVSGYSDIDGNEDQLVSEYLCWGLSVLHDLNVDTSSGEPGKFLPNRVVMRAEMWKALSEMIGFMPYQAQCSLVAGENEWFNPYLGTLCDKGLLAEYEPAEVVTLEEWYDTLNTLKLFMQTPATRVRIAEALIRIFVGSPSVYDTECTSQFSDVMDDSFDCVVSNRAVDLGLMMGYQEGTFRPDTEINWAELLKLTTMVTPVTPQDTGCYEENCDSWYCQYIDPFCDRGLLPENMLPSGNMTNGEAFRFAYEVYLDLP